MALAANDSFSSKIYDFQKERLEKLAVPNGSLKTSTADLDIALLAYAPIRYLWSEKTISLYRAVNPQELIDITSTNMFKNLYGLEGKYFTTSAAEASAYAKQAVKAFRDEPYNIIMTEAPKSILRNLSPASVDRGIQAWVIPENRLQALKPVIMDYLPLPPKGF